MGYLECIVVLIENDDMATYLRFLEDVFPYMDKYRYDQGMDDGQYLPDYGRNSTGNFAF